MENFEVEFTFLVNPRHLILKYIEEIKWAKLVDENQKTKKTMEKVEMALNALDQGQIKINCDGAASLKQVEARCGGLLWDFKGEWIKGFVKRLGPFNLLKSRFKV